MNYADNFLLSHRLLEENGFLQHIYGALSSMDLSAAVLGALQGMCITRSLPYIPKTEKNVALSSICRNEGNDHFNSECYQKALECYNKALLFAPKGSMELILAISNRSALLFKLKAYSASFHDIETCLKLGCSGGLLEKLKKRKVSCTNMIASEMYKTFSLVHGFPEEFFKFNEKKHPEIPCLSADVDIISISGEKRVAASKDIEIGTVVVVETAFATCSARDKSQVACYFCQKMSFNLIPCDNCCYALFCSTECQKRCVSEYHDIECQIMSVLEALSEGSKFRLIIKTVFKLIKKCKTWSKLIEESNIGANVRLNTSSLGQIYNVENYSSMLCFNENYHFVHGILYNHSFMYAIVIHYLEKISGFFPATPRDLEAKKCFAELCMRLGMMYPYVTEMNSTAENFSDMQIRSDNAPSHFGLFALTGKLNHSCDPNVVVIGLNNRVALVAVKPIKKMTEITISKILQDRGHFKDNCYALSKLEELVNTAEHIKIYGEFRSQLGLFQYAATLNSMI
ncbi:hypothetical protein MSG28_013495 [Choristoneura fumiferana]|uniref:Uncharacterized protein n=1 Tax=Choristoneura fumiferana TaxID=7141 RepID=A0ACC0KTP5_CHOFU|nr:hypothetical protein MSG28_013495 [Choristoneura fumiferana]